MADASDIAEVRRATNEPNDTNGYTDVLIGAYIDASDVAGAAAKIWSEKAAKYAELVNTSEAGASHAFSDLHKHAIEMFDFWDAQSGIVVGATEGRVRVRKIQRS